MYDIWSIISDGFWLNFNRYDRGQGVVFRNIKQFFADKQADYMERLLFVGVSTAKYNPVLTRKTGKSTKHPMKNKGWKKSR